jgi:hypothetical protein
MLYSFVSTDLAILRFLQARVEVWIFLVVKVSSAWYVSAALFPVLADCACADIPFVF